MEFWEYDLIMPAGTILTVRTSQELFREGCELKRGRKLQVARQARRSQPPRLPGFPDTTGAEGSKCCDWDHSGQVGRRIENRARYSTFVSPKTEKFGRLSSSAAVAQDIGAGAHVGLTMDLQYYTRYCGEVSRAVQPSMGHWSHSETSADCLSRDGTCEAIQ